MITEADTCRKYVVPKLQQAGWENSPHAISEQKTFTDGRISAKGRGPAKRADYLLRYTRDVLLAVVEAKAAYKRPDEGLQQAKDYAEVLGLKFAYSTNGRSIIEFDYLTGQERYLDQFPTPEELWQRLRAGQRLADDQRAKQFLTPAHHQSGRSPRYYQEIAINRTIEAILSDQKRVLLTMATGTGKTVVAFQICWKLWSAGWNRAGEYRKPKILYLADRNILIDDPKDKTFAPFGDARWKIENGVANKGREMYFAIYQALAKDERRPGLYREYAPDFFDLIVVDECHRGSASDESSWREILEYFAPAYQLGMTATPKRDDNVDTYRYFGNPIYQYSLKDGIEDGFLAPYRVHRVITSYDAHGWRPSPGERDRYGREIPAEEYQTQDFERAVALRARTEAIAKHLTDYLRQTDRFAKTIVFCVDQEHAAEMRQLLTNLNADLAQQYPDYVCQVTNNQGTIGRGHLGRFQDPETISPVILTTSQMLTTGVDAPTCKNVVLARVVNSMTEFKQIIGRGTRVRDAYGKLSFSIIDYTNSATRMFRDPEFDGDPVFITEQEIDDEGQTVAGSYTALDPHPSPSREQPEGYTFGPQLASDDEGAPRKYYADGGSGGIDQEIISDLDDAGRLRVVKIIDHTRDTVRTLSNTAADVRKRWGDPQQRTQIIALLKERGIDFDELAAALKQPEADPFDLLCHIAYSAPIRTRRERADRLRQEERAFFEHYGADARAVLDDLLEKYAEHGMTQFAIPEVLKVPPISERGNVSEIIRLFGGANRLREAVNELQRLLYAA
jgi:type I restriction enzyme R subunit